MRPEDLGIGRLFEKALAAVIVADAETQQVVLWNPVARDMFGYSLSEALELRVEVLVPTHLKAEHRAGMIRYEERARGLYRLAQAGPARPEKGWRGDPHRAVAQPHRAGRRRGRRQT